MNVEGFNDVLLRFFRNQMRHIHTIKIAKVSEVNHSNNSLSAEILSDTRYANGLNMPQPEVIDVPYFILSGSKGDAKITMPISSGDLVLILFSDRDYETFLDTSGDKVVSSKNIRTHDYNPILALPCFYTAPTATDVSDEDIVVSNKSSKITIKPDGDIEIESSSAVSVTAPEATINGNLTVTGETTLGPLVTSGGLNIGSTHTHSGVTSGGGTSGPPV